MKLLVARRGAPVVREEVAALLWPDEPDRSARRLSVLLSTIRGVLDPAKSMPPDHYVAADHDTVWLVREHVEIDVEMFLRDAAEGRRQLVAGDVAAGEQTLARAAARYLGEFCADDPYADWAAGTRGWPATRSSSWPASSPASPTTGPSTVTPSGTGCGSSTSTRTTRTPTWT